MRNCKHRTHIIARTLNETRHPTEIEVFHLGDRLEPRTEVVHSRTGIPDPINTGTGYDKLEV